MKTELSRAVARLGGVLLPGFPNIKILSNVPYIAILAVLGFAGNAFAADTGVKLNSNDGTTKFVVQDMDAAAVFSAGSDGNASIIFRLLQINCLHYPFDFASLLRYDRSTNHQKGARAPGFQGAHSRGIRRIL